MHRPRVGRGQRLAAERPVAALYLVDHHPSDLTLASPSIATMASVSFVTICFFRLSLNTPSMSFI